MQENCISETSVKNRSLLLLPLTCFFLFICFLLFFACWIVPSTEGQVLESEHFFSHFSCFRNEKSYLHILVKRSFWTMDICANVQYNKVLEADPLELLEVGCRTLKVGHGVLGSRPRSLRKSAAELWKPAAAEKWKQISNSRHFQFAIVDGYNQFQFASYRFNSKSRTNLIQIRNSEQIRF